MANIKDFEEEMKKAKTHAKRSYNKFWSSDVHGILADWLEDHDDPRSFVVRNRMKNSKAHDKAAQGSTGRLYNFWDEVRHKFLDGSNLYVFSYSKRTPEQERRYVVPEKPNKSDVNYQVTWNPFKGVYYSVAMTKEEFVRWVRAFSEYERNRLLITLQNHPQTAIAFEESRTFDSFGNFLKNEMAGTGAVYDGTKSKDFQWWGSPESMIRPKRRKYNK